MKITHGTAIYTGGGNYSVIGELDNGLYFNGCNDWCAAFDKDTRTWDEENDDLACFWNDWCEKHEVKVNQKELNSAFKDFCERLDNKEVGITKGYEKFSNYHPGEVTDYIDFDDFDLKESKVKRTDVLINKIIAGTDVRKVIFEAVSVSVVDKETGQGHAFEIDPWGNGKDHADITKKSVKSIVNKAMDVLDNDVTYYAEVIKVKPDEVVLLFHLSDDDSDPMFNKKQVSKKLNAITKGIQERLGDLGVIVKNPTFKFDEIDVTPKNMDLDDIDRMEDVCVYVSYGIEEKEDSDLPTT